MYLAAFSFSQPKWPNQVDIPDFWWSVYSFSTLFFDVSRDSKDVVIDTMYSRKFGRCYSIRFAKGIVKQGIAEIGFLSKMNTYIYFHHPGRIMFNI